MWHSSHKNERKKTQREWKIPRKKCLFVGTIDSWSCLSLSASVDLRHPTHTTWSFDSTIQFTYFGRRRRQEQLFHFSSSQDTFHTLIHICIYSLFRTQFSFIFSYFLFASNYFIFCFGVNKATIKKSMSSLRILSKHKFNKRFFKKTKENINWLCTKCKKWNKMNRKNDHLVVCSLFLFHFFNWSSSSFYLLSLSDWQNTNLCTLVQSSNARSP